MFWQSYAIIGANKWAKLQMLLDVYDTLITDNRNQYNVTNIDKQLTYVKQTIYRLSDRTVKYEIYLQT